MMWLMWLAEKRRADGLQESVLELLLLCKELLTEKELQFVKTALSKHP